MIEKHLRYTQSDQAARILLEWEKNSRKFVKVIPKDYKRMMQNIEEQRQIGLPDDEVMMKAFEATIAKQKKKNDKKVKTVI